MVYLEDAQIADVRVGEELNIINLEHSACHYDIKAVDLDISKLSKGGFDHFMLKEIYDQPNCLKDCMSGRLFADYYQMIEELSEIPQKMEKVLEQAPIIKDISRMFTYAHNFLYLGRGVNYPVAMEGALKLKEISYIHAEGYPAAEMKHGPIALVDQDMPIVFLATHHQLYEKIISNMQEVKSRNGRILAVVTEGDQQVKEIADNVLEVPRTLNALVPLLSVVPLQLLAYYVAVDKGQDVDMPRNLAKSVTVE